MIKIVNSRVVTGGGSLSTKGKEELLFSFFNPISKGGYKYLVASSEVTL